MITTLVAFAVQSPTLFADQSWKLSFAIVGKFGSTPGSRNPYEIKNPSLTGDLALTNNKAVDKDHDVVHLQLKLKMDQNDLITSLTQGFPTKDSPESTAMGMYSDKNFAYVEAKFLLDRTKATSAPYSTDSAYGSTSVLGPIGIGLAVMERGMMAPELKKEFFLSEDGPRKFYVTFKPNLNATTDSKKGEAAFAFQIKMNDQGKDYPNFFTGALRLNIKTKKVQYFRATSKVSDGPAGPEDAVFSQAETLVVNIESK